jgi:thiol-disulfide isomerase/thioredoxin
VIPLSDKNFTKFVTDRPRDYHAVLLFTATGKQYQCGVCVKTQGVYEEIAGLYNAQYDFNKTDIEKKVVFFKIEVDNARAIFTELQLETVPRLFFLPPAAVGAPKAQISKFEVDNHVLLDGTKRILQEINQITGVKVNYVLVHLMLMFIPLQLIYLCLSIKVEVTVDPAPLVLALCALAALAALFVSAAQGDLYGAVLWYQSPKIWSGVSAVS